ncbi:MAG TPA: thioesterase family protein [Burkholderiaceae bacterium]
MTEWDYPEPFELALSPQAADIDGLNHTNNAVYVRWCEQIGWAHSEALGLSLADYQRLNAAMAIRSARYDYELPSALGEALVLGTWLTAGDGRLSMERRFQLRRVSDGVTLMRGEWKLVCIAMDTGRPRRMPAEFVACYQTAVVPAVGPGDDR